MKIGFAVSFFDFRNDVRKVIEIISLHHKVVVFYKPSDEEKVLSHKIDNVEYRPIFDRNRTFLNRIKEQLFLYFKKLPKSRNNYFLMELFKISNMKSLRAKRKAMFIFKAQKLLPRLMSYDSLINWLNPLCKTNINNVDRFIFFTEIADDYFLTRLIKEKKDILTYVYSWDHPCKHTKFSKKVKYVCWSEGIKEDIIKLQGIDPHNIEAKGASQFGFLYEFLHDTTQPSSRTYPFDYIYFGCAIGIKDLVPDEIRVIKQLAGITFKKSPNLKFIVRPYPLLDQWSLYEDLRTLPNIILDDSFRKKDLSINNSDILSKFEKIWHAKAFLHLGTTLGLEACFSETPSFIVDFGYEKTEGLSLHAFIHQYQNDKYLVNATKVNTLRNIHEYIQFLESDKCESYLEINGLIKKQFPVYSFSEFSNKLFAS